MNHSELSSAHENSIRRLTEEFGQSYKDIISSTYETERKKLEADARILTFVPILACIATRKVLQNTMAARNCSPDTMGTVRHFTEK